MELEYSNVPRKEQVQKTGIPKSDGISNIFKCLPEGYWFEALKKNEEYIKEIETEKLNDIIQ